MGTLFPSTFCFFTAINTVKFGGNAVNSHFFLNKKNNETWCNERRRMKTIGGEPAKKKKKLLALEKKVPQGSVQRPTPTEEEATQPPGVPIFFLLFSFVVVSNFVNSATTTKFNL